MKSILETLEDIKDAVAGKGESRFLKLEDGESVTLRFLQELDGTGKNYDEARGHAVGVREHMNPKNSRQSFLCSAEDGRCYGCEQVTKNPKWKARGRLLVNVLVRGKNKEEGDSVKIFGTSLSKKGLMPEIIDYYEEDGTLTGRDFKLKRTGVMFDTKYTLNPREVSPLKKTDAEQELHPLDEAFRKLSYDEQVDLIEGDEQKEDW